MRIVLIIVIMLLFLPADLFGDTLVKLPAPETEGGMTLMRALKDRSSTRAFSEKDIPDQILSNLLWAAFGINRPDSGKRTAPSALNMQEIDVYVAMETGLYLYDPVKHSLELILSEDIRQHTGKQEFVKDAPLNLIFVADTSKMERAGDQKDLYAAMDAGFISQNVYLYCASEDLATVVRGWIDKEALAQAMELTPGKKIVLAQTVGYKK